MPCHRPLGAVEIRPARQTDLPIVAELARLIWRRCYAGMISEAQIEYMLASRYDPVPLASDVDSGRLAYTLLLVDGEVVAFSAHGPADDPRELKLNQLYVHPDWQGRGLGSQLIEHVSSIARALGRAALVLTVNRRNARAQAAYRRHGFLVRAEANFDIGQGYVMEDYVMARPLTLPAVGNTHLPPPPAPNVPPPPAGAPASRG